MRMRVVCLINSFSSVSKNPTTQFEYATIYTLQYICINISTQDGKQYLLLQPSKIDCVQNKLDDDIY